MITNYPKPPPPGLEYPPTSSIIEISVLATENKASDNDSQKYSRENSQTRINRNSEKFEVLSSKRISSNVMEKIANLRHSEIYTTNMKRTDEIIYELSMKNHKKAAISLYQAEEVEELPSPINNEKLGKFETMSNRENIENNDVVDGTCLLAESMIITKNAHENLNVIDDNADILKLDIRSNILAQIENTYPNPPPPGLQYPNLPNIIRISPQMVEDDLIDGESEKLKQQQVINSPVITQIDEPIPVTHIKPLPLRSDSELEKFENEQKEKLTEKLISELLTNFEKSVLMKSDNKITPKDDIITHESIQNQEKSIEITETASTDIKGQEGIYENVQVESPKHEENEIIKQEEKSVEIIENVIKTDEGIYENVKVESVKHAEIEIIKQEKVEIIKEREEAEAIEEKEEAVKKPSILELTVKDPDSNVNQIHQKVESKSEINLKETKEVKSKSTPEAKKIIEPKNGSLMREDLPKESVESKIINTQNKINPDSNSNDTTKKISMSDEPGNEVILNQPTLDNNKSTPQNGSTFHPESNKNSKKCCFCC